MPILPSISSYTSACALAETCVFDKQSLGPFHCGFSFKKHPFSRSYGVILPSSLTRVLSRVLGFSPHLPVSVCGTGTHLLARGFSWQRKIGNFATIVSLPFTTQPLLQADLPTCKPYCLDALFQPCAFPIFLRHPFAQSMIRWYRNINLLSIAYAFRPRLRS